MNSHKAEQEGAPMSLNEPINDAAKHDYETHRAESVDGIRYQVDFAQSLLQKLLLVNGGAIIALLTFIGNAKKSIDFNCLWYGFAGFSFGIVCALIAYFGAFFSQLQFMSVTVDQMSNAQHRMYGREEPVTNHELERVSRNGNLALWLGVVLASLSLAGFIAGAFYALDGIL